MESAQTPSTELTGVDHAAAIMSPPGARASAELINEALTTGAHS